MRIRCCKAALGRFLFALCALVCLNGSLFAQKKVDYKSDWGERMPSAPDNMVLKGNVVFVHEKMTMLCDSAVFYTAEDFIEAFGSIHIYQDTLHLYGSRADYDTRLRVAQIFGDEVLLLDGKTRLTTDYMVWERDFATVRYTDGAKIQDEENTLTSTLGTYHTDTKVFDFAGEVVVNAASADIFADSLSYASKTDEVFFVCPTRILTSDSILILTSLGTYNTKSREAQLRLDNFVQNSSNTLVADSIDYNTSTKEGIAVGSVEIADTANNVFAYSNYLQSYRNADLLSAFLTDSVLLVQVDEGDTLFMHCDTLRVDFDTADKADRVLAWAHVKAYRSDMQAACELADYDVKNSTALLLVRPVLWQEENQFTADTIRIAVKEKKIDRMWLFPNAFIVQDSDTAQSGFYNQISAKRLEAAFSKNRIAYCESEGNVNMVYHLWEEKKGKPKELTGVNIGVCAKLRMYFDKGKLKRMTAVQDPDFYLDDIERISPEARTLKGFILLDGARPKSKEDIFIHRD